MMDDSLIHMARYIGVGRIPEVESPEMSQRLLNDLCPWTEVEGKYLTYVGTFVFNQILH